MKEKLQFIVISFFMWLLFSTINVLANSYQYDSSDVLYDNSNTDIESTDVQGAVSELYQAATDYSSLNGRVTNLEGYFQNNPNVVFNQYGINVQSSNTGSDKQTYINLSNNNVASGSIVSSSEHLSISSRDSSGTWATGSLGLLGSTINIGNKTNDATVNINGKELVSGMKVYSFGDKSKLGITSTTTFDEIVKTKLPSDSILYLWINQQTTYGTEIESALSTKYGFNFYGTCKFEKSSINSTEYQVMITCKRYNSHQSFVYGYSSVNGGSYAQFDPDGWTMVGDIVTKEKTVSNVSVATNTNTTILSDTLPKGTWIVKGHIKASTSYSNNFVFTVGSAVTMGSGGTGFYADWSLTDIYESDGTTNSFKMNIHHTLGSNMTFSTVNYKAIKIK